MATRKLGSLSVDLVAEAGKFVSVLQDLQNRIREFSNTVSSLRVDIGGKGQSKGIKELTTAVASLTSALGTYSQTASTVKQANAEIDRSMDATARKTASRAREMTSALSSVVKTTEQIADKASRNISRILGVQGQPGQLARRDPQWLTDYRSRGRFKPQSGTAAETYSAVDPTTMLSTGRAVRRAAIDMSQAITTTATKAVKESVADVVPGTTRRVRAAFAAQYNPMAEQLSAVTAKAVGSTLLDSSTSFVNGLVTSQRPVWRQARDAFGNIMRVRDTFMEEMFNLSQMNVRQPRRAQAIPLAEEALAARAQYAPTPYGQTYRRRGGIATMIDPGQFVNIAKFGRAVSDAATQELREGITTAGKGISEAAKTSNILVRNSFKGLAQAAEIVVRQTGISNIGGRYEPNAPVGPSQPTRIYGTNLTAPQQKGAFVPTMVGREDLERLRNAGEAIKTMRSETHGLLGIPTTGGLFNKIFGGDFIGSVETALAVVIRFNTARMIMQGVQQSFTFAAQSSIQFEDAMKQVQAISGSTDAEMRILSEAVRDVGRNTIISATEAAKGLQILAQAGFKAREAAAALPSVFALAVGGVTSTEQAANLLTSALRAFNVEAERSPEIANVLTATVNKSKSSIEDLNIAFNYAGTISAEAGLSIKDFGALVGTLADNGVRASTQGTAVRQFISGLIEPTERARKVFEKLNISLSDINPLTNDLGKVLQTLRDRGFGVSEAFEAFEARAASSIAILVSQRDHFEDLRIGISGTNAAFEAMEKRQQSFAAQSTILGNKLADIFIGIGRSIEPMAASMVKSLTHVVDVLRYLPEAAAILGGATFLGIFTRVAAAIQNLQIQAAAARSIELMLTSWSGAAATASVSVTALGTAVARLRALTTPVNLVIGGLLTLLGLIVNANRKAREEQEQFNAALEEQTDKVIQTSEAHRRLVEQAEAYARVAAESVGNQVSYMNAISGVRAAVEELAFAFPELRNQIGTTDQMLQAVMGGLRQLTVEGPIRAQIARLKQQRDELEFGARSALEGQSLASVSPTPLADINAARFEGKASEETRKRADVYTSMNQGLVESAQRVGKLNTEIDVLNSQLDTTKKRTAAVRDLGISVREAFTVGAEDRGSIFQKAQQDIVLNFIKNLGANSEISKAKLKSLGRALLTEVRSGRELTQDFLGKAVEAAFPTEQQGTRIKASVIELKADLADMADSARKGNEGSRTSIANFTKDSSTLVTHVDTLKKKFAGLNAELEAQGKGLSRFGQESAQAQREYEAAVTEIEKDFTNVLKVQKIDPNDVKITQREAFNALKARRDLALEAADLERKIATINAQISEGRKGGGGASREANALERLDNTRANVLKNEVLAKATEIALNGDLAKAINMVTDAINENIDARKKAAAKDPKTGEIDAQRLEELRQSELDKAKSEILQAVNRAREKNFTQEMREITAKIRVKKHEIAVLKELQDVGELPGGRAKNVEAIRRMEIENNINELTLRRKEVVQDILKQTDQLALLSELERSKDKEKVADIERNIAARREEGIAIEQNIQLEEIRLATMLKAGDVIVNFGDVLSQGIEQAYEGIILGTSKLKDVFKNLGTSILSSITQALAKSMIEKLGFDEDFKLNFMNLGGFLFDVLGGAFTSIFGSAEAGVGGLENSIKGIFDTLGTTPGKGLFGGGGETPDYMKEDFIGPRTEEQQAAFNATQGWAGAIGGVVNAIIALAPAVVSFIDALGSASKSANNFAKVSMNDPASKVYRRTAYGSIAAFTGIGAGVGAAVGSVVPGIGTLVGAGLGAALGAMISKILTREIGKVLSGATLEAREQGLSQSKLQRNITHDPLIMALTGGMSAQSRKQQDQVFAIMNGILAPFTLGLTYMVTKLFRSVIDGMIPDIEVIFDKILQDTLKQVGGFDINRQLKQRPGRPGGTMGSTARGEAESIATGPYSQSLSDAARMFAGISGAGFGNEARVKRFFNIIVNNIAMLVKRGHDLEKTVNRIVIAVTGGNFIGGIAALNKAFSTGRHYFYELLKTFNKAYAQFFPTIKDLSELTNVLLSDLFLNPKAVKQSQKAIKKSDVASSFIDAASANDALIAIGNSFASIMKAKMTKALTQAFFVQGPLGVALGAFFQVINKNLRKAFRAGGMTQDAETMLFYRLEKAGKATKDYLETYKSEIIRVYEITHKVLQDIEEVLKTDDTKTQEWIDALQVALGTLIAAVGKLFDAWLNLFATRARMIQKIFDAQNLGNEDAEGKIAPGVTDALLAAISGAKVIYGELAKAAQDLKNQGRQPDEQSRDERRRELGEIESAVDAWLAASKQAITDAYEKVIEVGKKAEDLMKTIKDSIRAIVTKDQQKPVEDRLAKIQKEINKQKEIMMTGSPEEQLAAAEELKKLYAEQLDIASEEMDQSGPQFASVRGSVLSGLSQVSEVLEGLKQQGVEAKEAMVKALEDLGAKAKAFYEWLQTEWDIVNTEELNNAVTNLNLILGEIGKVTGAVGGVAFALVGLYTLTKSQLDTLNANILLLLAKNNVTGKPNPETPGAGPPAAGLPPKQRLPFATSNEAGTGSKNIAKQNLNKDVMYVTNKILDALGFAVERAAQPKTDADRTTITMIRDWVVDKTKGMKYIFDLGEQMNWSTIAQVVEALIVKVGYLNDQSILKIPRLKEYVGNELAKVRKTAQAARGAVVLQDSLVNVGEAGPEAIVPLNTKGLRRFFDIIQEAFMGAMQNNARTVGGFTDRPLLPQGGKPPVNVSLIISPGAFVANINGGDPLALQRLPKDVMDTVINEARYGRLRKVIQDVAA